MPPPVTESATHAAASRAHSQSPRFFVSRQKLRLAVYALLILCDAVAIRVAFEVGVSLRGSRWLEPNGIELGWLVLPIHVLIGLRMGAYGRDAVISRIESVRRGTSTLVIATALVCMLIFFQYAGELVSRLAFGVSMLLALIAIAVMRVVFLSLFVTQRGDWMVHEVMIVDGTPPPAGFRGEVIDAQADVLEPDVRDPTRLERIAERVKHADRVIVACAHTGRRSRWAAILKSLDLTGEILLDEGNPLGAIGLGRFRGNDTVIVSRGPLSVANRITKRVMDIVIAGLALLFLAPLLILTAIAIRLDSPGPIFFAQPRTGRGNRTFRILKFRSMRSDAGDLAGNRSASRDDDRVTRVGALIRKTSIDELPQLINVLKGEMSLVGPRPHALGSLAGDKLFWEVNETYWRRHQLKPGITGLAQVRGYRGATHHQADLENRLQADLEYISGWSLWRDIKIIIATLRVVVHPRAY